MNACSRLTRSHGVELGPAMLINGAKYLLTSTSLYVTMEEMTMERGNGTMAIRKIRTEGDAVLRKTCREVTEMTPKLAQLIEDMIDTMYEANGVGLAAPQVGVLRNIVVIDVNEEEPDPIILVNPEILETSGEQTGDEGCLSVPGKSGIVTRPDYVKVRAYDENMNEFEMEGTGLLARAVCHECDHLKGILYVDKVEGPLKSATFAGEE